jgi:hypothetical protein
VPFHLRAQHVRTRLTLWYVFILAGILLISWGVTAIFLFFQMRGQLDHYAVQDIETIEGLLFFDRDGRLILREDYHNHPQSKYVLERLVDIRSTDGAVLFRRRTHAGRRARRLLHSQCASRGRGYRSHGKPPSYAGRQATADPPGLQ